MAAWIKGEKCGVGNCPSRFWQLADGQYVCQHGHVRHGGHEFGQDDEDFFATGQLRVRKKRIQKALTHGGKVRARLPPDERYKLALCIIQDLLSAQIRFMINVVGCPSCYGEVVRDIFHRAVSVSTEYHEFVPPGLAPFRHRKHESIKFEKITTLMALYLGCRYMQLPIYMYEILHWVEQRALPFFNLPLFVDPKLLSHMPSLGYSALNNFDQRLTAHYFEPHFTRFLRLLNRFGDNIYEPKPVLVEPLVFKLVRHLALPPHMYPAVLRIVQIYGFSDGTTKNARADMVNKTLFIEQTVFACAIVAIKLLYGLDGIHREISPESPAADHPDWQMWGDVVRKLWNFGRDIGDLDDRAAAHLSREKKLEYLQWYQRAFVDSPLLVGKQLGRAKHLLMSDLPGMDSKNYLEMDADGMLDFVPPQVLDELNALLTESVGEDLSDLSVPEVAQPPPARSSRGAYSRGPGSLYQSYRPNMDAAFSDMPELLEMLENIHTQFFVTSPAVSRIVVRRVEGKLKEETNSVYRFMEREGTLASIIETNPIKLRNFKEVVENMKLPRPPLGYTKYPAVAKDAAAHAAKLQADKKRTSDEIRPELTEEQRAWGYPERPAPANFLHPVQVTKKLRPTLTPFAKELLNDNGNT